MSAEPYIDPQPAKALVQRLQAAGYTPAQLSLYLGGRVSARTIYRWWRGGSYPQNTSDVSALRTLADRLAPVAVEAEAESPV